VRPDAGSVASGGVEADCVRDRKRAAVVEQDRDARHVQRLGNPARHRFEQRPRLDHVRTSWPDR
jgi:hypothetical protein